MYNEVLVELSLLTFILLMSSAGIVHARVSQEDSNLALLVDFAVNFIDQQRLKTVEDKVLDLMIVFESLQSTIAMLVRECTRNCLGSDCVDCICGATSEKLFAQLREVEVNLRKTQVLHKRVQSTATLLSQTVIVNALLLSLILS
jgi:hypothetical protein